MGEALSDPYRSSLFYLGETAGRDLPRKDAPMATVQTENWWSLFLDMHGRDSEEEKAFLGFLQTKGIPAMASPDVLAQAYTEFQAFVEESYARDASADKPPEQKPARPLSPRSAFSVPEYEKPQFAATRPLDLRDEEAAKQPSPLSDPNAASAGTPPEGGQVLSSGMSQAAPPPKTPEEEAKLQEEEQQSQQRGRRGRE